MATGSVRAQQALATRRRMVQAAYRQFCRTGYHGTTMNAIAQDAGVAVQTVYYTFRTKAALLDAALGGAIIGFDRWREPPPQPDIVELMPWHSWWDEFQAAPTSAEALDVFVSHGVSILERVAPLVAAMHGAACDPDAEKVVTIGEARRIDSYREVVRALARKPPGLRRGLRRAAATDILGVLFSAELYQALSNGRGWSQPRCATFFRRLLANELLGAQPPVAPRRPDDLD